MQDKQALADLARAYSNRLVASLKREGILTSPLIEEALNAVPRHEFMGQFYVHDELAAEKEQWRLVQRASEEDATAWLEMVYSNEALITAFDEFGGPTSSSSAPGIMALMLEALDLHPGLRVLEIGTGTGYNLALLAHIAGDPRKVFSVELDAALAHQAQQRLDHVVGKGTTIHIGNGLEGYSQAAPYDGIIASGSYHKVPLPWLDQLQDGGVLVMDLKKMGILQLKKVGTKRAAHGRFLAPSAFMELRESGEVSTPNTVSLFAQYSRRPMVKEMTLSQTEFDPALLEDTHFAFLLQQEFPHTRLLCIPQQEQLPLTFQLLDSASETLIVFRSMEQSDTWKVEVRGELHTWERLYQVYQQWAKLGRPTVLEYVVDINEAGKQYVTISRPIGKVRPPTWVLAG
jgi:protein-L-isoaspartate(D-aspartate) O-methyltransferase